VPSSGFSFNAAILALYSSFFCFAHGHPDVGAGIDCFDGLGSSIFRQRDELLAFGQLDLAVQHHIRNLLDRLLDFGGVAQLRVINLLFLSYGRAGAILRSALWFLVFRS
jgi:hypothetical protein